MHLFLQFLCSLQQNIEAYAIHVCVRTSFLTNNLFNDLSKQVELNLKHRETLVH